MSDAPTMLAAIDLGTTRIALAYPGADGRPEVFESPGYGHFLTAVLRFGRSKVEVGVAGDGSGSSSVKRRLGTRDWHRIIGDKAYSAETLASILIRRLLDDVEASVGLRVGRVTLTVPSMFNDVDRKAMQDAALIAGVEVTALINESEAAALAWGLDHPGEEGKFLVYRLGGGTFDATILKVAGARVETLAVDGDRTLGGEDWDVELANVAAERFRSEHGGDPRDDAGSAARLFAAAEAAKIALSTTGESQVSVEHDGHSVSVDITRDGFEALTQPLLERTELALEAARAAAGVEWTELRGVMLLGGMSRMPAVSRMLERITGHAPMMPDNAELLPVRGAAWFNLAIHLAWAGDEMKPVLDALDPAIRPVLTAAEVVSVSAHPLGVVGRRRADGRMVNCVMVPRNVQLPVEVIHPFATSSDDQAVAVIKVVEGASERPEECVDVGWCEIRGLPPGTPKGSVVDVIYHYRMDGRLEVAARHHKSGEEIPVQVVRTNGMSDDEVKAAQADLAALEVV